MTDDSRAVYTRIRGSMCEQHGLAGISGLKDQPRDDPRLLDEHAAQITVTVLDARKKRAA